MAFFDLHRRKGLAELLIIVTGVMIALAADRWRDSQRDEHTTASYLERLRSDVEADIAAFGTTVAWAGAIDQSCLQVLDRVESFADDARRPTPCRRSATD